MTQPKKFRRFIAEIMGHHRAMRAFYDSAIPWVLKKKESGDKCDRATYPCIVFNVAERFAMDFVMLSL